MPTFSALDAQVVKPTGSGHDLVREALSEIAQDIFDGATDLHTGQRMFTAHTNPRQALIGAFL